MGRSSYDNGGAPSSSAGATTQHKKFNKQKLRRARAARAKAERAAEAAAAAAVVERRELEEDQARIERGRPQAAAMRLWECARADALAAQVAADLERRDRAAATGDGCSGPSGDGGDGRAAATGDGRSGPNDGGGGDGGDGDDDDDGEDYDYSGGGGYCPDGGYGYAEDEDAVFAAELVANDVAEAYDYA